MYKPLVIWNMLKPSYFILIIYCTLTESRNLSGHHQYRLYKYLFEGYNPMLLPRSLVTKNVEVTLEYELNSVSGLDEVNQVMYTVGFVVVEWYDEWLKWFPDNYGGIKHLVVPPNKVWLPDIAIKNSADKFYDASFTRDFRVDIQFDGRIIWSFGGNFATSCTLDMTYYPFDLQKCDILIENWAYTADHVDLKSKNKAIHLQDFSPNGEWGLDHTSTKREEFNEDTHPNKKFPRVVFSIYLSRKFRYYLINIVLPALFLITISLTVFWLPPDAGEKVSLGITVLLAFSVFQLVIMEHTPRTSDFTPVMTLLFTIIMGESTFSVLTSILVLYFHHHGAETRPPKFIRHIAFKYLAKVLGMCNQVPPGEQEIPEMNEEASFVKKTSLVEHPVINHNNSVNNKNQSENSEISRGECYLKEMLVYVKELTAKVHLRERDETIMQEWKAVAKVIDRTFFWIAFIVTVIIVPVLLFQKDSEHV